MTDAEIIEQAKFFTLMRKQESDQPEDEPTCGTAAYFAPSRRKIPDHIHLGVASLLDRPTTSKERFFEGQKVKLIRSARFAIVIDHSGSFVRVKMISITKEGPKVTGLDTVLANTLEAVDEFPDERSAASEWLGEVLAAKR
jgi:hypothetical protein